MAVDSVVCHWLLLKVEYDSSIHDGLGTVVGRCMGLLYADNGTIGSRDPEWIQGVTNVLMGIFRRVILMDNVVKSKTITCHIETICTWMSEEFFSLRSIGEGHTHQEHLKRSIPCPDYGVELTAGSITDHHRRLHGSETAIDWD